MIIEKNSDRSVPLDQRTEEWFVGLRIGLALAEEMSEVMRRGGRIDVLDEHGEVIFSSRIDQLPGRRPPGRRGAMTLAPVRFA